ncbi:hypothetical protein K438DRAFT_1778510 [Mycena galopus ATCC 62051]|nr:hypothetical protein K438DRAFT_1778510 [Mycena galopus ATCC 62051]
MSRVWEYLLNSGASMRVKHIEIDTSEKEASRFNKDHPARNGLPYQIDSSCTAKRGTNHSQGFIYPPMWCTTGQQKSAHNLTELVLRDLDYTYRALILLSIAVTPTCRILRAVPCYGDLSLPEYYAIRDLKTRALPPVIRGGRRAEMTDNIAKELETQVAGYIKGVSRNHPHEGDENQELEVRPARPSKDKCLAFGIKN